MSLVALAFEENNKIFVRLSSPDTIFPAHRETMQHHFTYSLVKCLRSTHFSFHITLSISSVVQVHPPGKSLKKINELFISDSNSQNVQTQPMSSML